MPRRWPRFVVDVFVGDNDADGICDLDDLDDDNDGILDVDEYGLEYDKDIYQDYEGNIIKF